MAFNWQRYIRDNCTGSHKGARSGTEIIIDCPAQDCPNPKNHFFFNTSKELGFCHRCGAGLNGIAFIMAISKLSYLQAVYFISEQGKTRDIKQIKKRLQDFSLEEQYLLTFEKKFIIELPKGYISKVVKAITDPLLLDKNGNRTILSGRGIKKALAKKVGVGVCFKGIYKGRVIFPIECNGNKTFLAYDVKGFSKRKILNAEGGETTSECLYLYDWFKSSNKRLFVVEGIFDVLRLISFGYNSVALFKTYVTDSQLHLLSMTNAKEVVFIWDSDVTEEFLFKRKILNRISNLVDKNISYILLKKGDPDTISSKAEFKSLLSKRIKYSKLNTLKRRLSNLKGRIR